MSLALRNKQLMVLFILALVTLLIITFVIMSVTHFAFIQSFSLPNLIYPRG